MNDRLYRSRSDRMLAGVAGGLADHFDLDPSLVRVLWAVLAIVSGGIFLLIYIVMAIVVPDEPLGGPSSGWSPVGSAGWSTSWQSAGGPAQGASGPPPAAPPPNAAGSAGSSAADPPVSGARAAGPAGGPGFAAPNASAPGFGAPIAGGWTPSGAPSPGAAPGGAPPPSTPWPDDPRAARRAARDARRAARRAARGYGSDHPGAGGIVAGLFLVALGAYFLVRTFAPQLDVDRYWPVGLVVLGALLIVLSIRRTPGPGAP